MESIYNDLKQRGLVFTNSLPNNGLYIMQDGLYLDLDASKEVTNRHGWHSDIDQLYQPVVQDRLVKSDNAIKVQMGNQRPPYILVAKSNLTKNQKDSLELAISSLLQQNKRFLVTVVDFDKNEYNNLEIDYEHSNAKDIINLIVQNC